LLWHDEAIGASGLVNMDVARGQPISRHGWLIISVPILTDRVAAEPASGFPQGGGSTMQAIALLALVVVGLVNPITPRELDDRLQTPIDAVAADVLAERIRASFPEKIDLAKGAHLVEGDSVAFVVEAPRGTKAVHLGGMLNHSQGFAMVPIGESGLWAYVAPIPDDTKFAYQVEADDKRLGGAVVEMPGWSYPPESAEQPGAKYGEYHAFSFRSEVFGNERTGWIYVPSAYDGQTPAALMVFQDGDAYKTERVGTVVDNLIAAGKMPVTILVLLNPGVNDDGSKNRSREYDTLSDQYARMLAEEVLPRVSKQYRLRDDPASRAIGGASSGGICAFTVAWERPELFGRVLSQIGSFTNIRGGHVYPELVRKAERKPIRVMMTDGTNDLVNRHGDWWQANQAMYAALAEKGYAVEFLKDRGFHAYWTCGRQLPRALEWLWQDVSTPRRP
jgi:enterochelin esterase family protein